jgi:predicted negative regulator of RcsB-dependent stress response
METQDAAAVYIFKLWPWVEANLKRIIAAVAIILAAVFIFYFVSAQREQKEIDAGKALTDAMVATDNGQLADSYLKISADYPSTLAGQRAQLQAASALFAAGQYAEAQAQFQKYIDAHPDGEFSGEASLGVAASLDAQGESDLAVGAYQQAIGSSDGMTASIAKLATARIYESQGKLNEALTLYADVARANPNGALGSEAAVRAMELKSRSPSAPSAAATTAPAAPFNLIH